jgi:hypothetical protein
MGCKVEQKVEGKTAGIASVQPLLFEDVTLVHMLIGGMSQRFTLVMKRLRSLQGYFCSRVCVRGCSLPVQTVLGIGSAHIGSPN